MAYTADVKSELMQSPMLESCCAGAELTALLLLSGSISLCGLGKYRLTFGSENAAVVRYCFTQLKRTYSLAPEIRAVRSNQRGEHTRYQLQLEGEESAALLRELRLLDPGEILGIRMRPGEELMGRECCQRAYLRGAFLACGWISQPEKAYHFEFAAPDIEQAGTLQEIMRRWELPARISARKSQQIVYVKKSEDVETLLGILGASSALLTFENVRIMKGLRNDLNRQMICDDFNTDKTVRAAAQQLEDIAVIEKYLGLGKLPDSLRQAAEARLNSPDATLSQLGELMEPPIAKSAVNKRIRRLGELAQRLRDEHGV